MKLPLLGHTVATVAGALLFAATPSPGVAAPATSEELSSAADVGAGPKPAGRSIGPVVTQAPSTTVPQSKTVELLLQLQDQPNAYSGAISGAPDPGRRSAKVDRGTAPGANAQAAHDEHNPLLNLKASILGPAQQRHAEQQDHRQSPDLGSAARQEASQGADSDRGMRDQADSLFSNPVVRYLRQNRGWVVSASLAALAAVWLTANFSMRRSR